jgi:hypothetical protein
VRGDIEKSQAISLQVLPRATSERHSHSLFERLIDWLSDRKVKLFALIALLKFSI